MKTRTTFLSLFLMLLFYNTIHASGIGIVDGSEGVYLTVVETHVHVEVNNQIATITATQVLKNETGSTVNYKYGFPLNENANPVQLRWLQDGIWDEAVVSANEQNDSIPGSGTGGDIAPGLKAYLGQTPMFFSPISSLENDSLITFELTYVELLPYFLGKVSFYLRNDLSQIQSESVFHQSFEFVLNSEREILLVDLLDISTTDVIDPYLATINYEIFEANADIDYLLEYELSSDGLGVIPLSTSIPDSTFLCDDLGNGYATFIIEPESNVNTEVIEKNFTLVIDRSGSMSGDKIVQARDAASFIVNNLNVGDKFNIVDFSSDVQTLFSEHVDYTLPNQNTALSYIDGLGAGGSTNISGALTTTIDQFQVVDPGKANIILFFTDGQATSGITDTPGILSTVQDAVSTAETSIFLFTFGIGENVDKELLTLLAQQNNGLVKFVEDEDLEYEITTFFLTINNPVLINTEITFEPDVISESYPYPYPNLYKGQQLILSGRYEEAQTINMHIEGQAFNVPVSYDFEFDLSDSNDISMSILPKIWAKQKIDALVLNSYLTSDQNVLDAILAEIDSISVCYGVVNVEFTSFEDDNPPVVEVDYVASPDSKFSILAGPNPFSNEVNITIEAAVPIYDEPVQLELFDMQGRSIFQMEKIMNGQELILHLDMLSALPRGTYLCKISIGGELIILQLIKK